MAYIGKTPTSGDFVLLDSITTSATASYTMQKNSVNFEPQSANHMILSLNGTIQAPISSFTVSGSTLTFASALTSSDVIDFILVLGNVNDVGTATTVVDSAITRGKLNLISDGSNPSLIAKGDGSSVEGKIQFNCENNTHGQTIQASPHSAGQSWTLKLPDNSPTADKFLKVKSITGSGATATGQLEFADAGGNTPAFQAYRTATQSISNSTFTKIQNNVELFDTDDAYDNSSNYRFTVPSAGKYVFGATANIHDLAVAKAINCAIYKNGSVLKENINGGGGSSNLPISVDVITIDDASVGDYYEAYVKQTHGSSRLLNYIYGNVFYGFKLGGV